MNNNDIEYGIIYKIVPVNQYTPSAKEYMQTIDNKVNIIPIKYNCFLLFFFSSTMDLKKNAIEISQNI